jgi:hypothetical protein
MVYLSVKKYFEAATLNVFAHGCKIQDAGSRIQDSGYKMHDAMQDPGCW